MTAFHRIYQSGGTPEGRGLPRQQCPQALTIEATKNETLTIKVTKRSKLLTIGGRWD